MQPESSPSMHGMKVVWQAFSLQPLTVALSPAATGAAPTRRHLTIGWRSTLTTAIGSKRVLGDKMETELCATTSTCPTLMTAPTGSGPLFIQHQVRIIWSWRMPTAGLSCSIEFQSRPQKWLCNEAIGCRIRCDTSWFLLVLLSIEKTQITESNNCSSSEWLRPTCR